MFYYTLKVAITAMLVLAVSEVARRSSLLGGILASIPNEPSSAVRPVLHPSPVK